MRWTPGRVFRVRALAGVIALCSWARHFTLTVPLSTHSINGTGAAHCLGNLIKYLGVTCDRLASHPGGVAILVVASCYGNLDKLDTHARAQALPFTTFIQGNKVLTVKLVSDNRLVKSLSEECNSNTPLSCT